MDILDSEGPEAPKLCPHGHVRNKSCACFTGQNTVDVDGCKAVLFDEFSVDRVIQLARPLDRPTPGCEAF